MYSPVIREDLIPLIYRAAKTENVRMTTWVNRAVEDALVLRERPQSEEQRKESDLDQKAEQSLVKV